MSSESSQNLDMAFTSFMQEDLAKATDSLIHSFDSPLRYYSMKRYLISVHTAEKPSRQVIFLPSEKLRPE